MDLDFLSVNKKREEKNVVYCFQVELDCRNFGFMWREKSPRSNIFHGRLTSVNMWDKVLSESDIAAQYKNCSVLHMRLMVLFLTGLHSKILLMAMSQLKSPELHRSMIKTSAEPKIKAHVM